MGVQNVDLTLPFSSPGLELPSGPITYYLRAEFQYDDLPSQTELALDTIIDDGAVFYLNGFEVYRENMPAGSVSYATPASSEVVNPTYTRDEPDRGFCLAAGRQRAGRGGPPGGRRRP